MKIEFLGAHMFESKTTRLSSILIDDVMAVDAGSLTSGLSFTDQAKVEQILLTHGHYDHIRDVAAFALRHQHRTTDIYGTQATLDILLANLINGVVYPKFTEWPSPEKPALKLNALEPYDPVTIGVYTVLPVPVPHALPSVGFQITDPPGKKLFYSGDTGPGLASCWEHIAPDVVIVDMTYSNAGADIAPKPGHLCPSLLREELVRFREMKRYLPKVIMTHLNPDAEHAVAEESRRLAEDLGIEIEFAGEGKVFMLE